MRNSPPRIRGRLAPESMFPAGRADIRTCYVGLSGGLSLRIAEAGDSSAPPIVLVHGWGASLYMWRAWFAPLAQAGYRVLAMDLPGHGLSDKPQGAGEYRLARQVEVLRELFEAEGLAGAGVVAQSMGGTIALELSVRHATAVGALALVNPAAFGRAYLQPPARLLTPAAVERVIGWVVPRWATGRAQRLAYADPSRVTEQDVDEYWAPSQDPGYARAMRRLLHEFEWRRQPVDHMASRLQSLASPPLVVLSGRDALLRDARPYVTALQRAGAVLHLLELPLGGHAVNEEEPEAVLPGVLAYLAIALRRD